MKKRMTRKLATPDSAAIELLRLEEACALLQVSRGKLDTLLRSRELQVTRLGHRSLRISRAELAKYVARRQVQASESITNTHER